jgi:PAS domain S-box-containing protein
MTEGFALHDIICDDQGVPCDYRFLEINPAFERLTGLKRADVIGKLHNTILPDDDPNWVKIYGKVALTGEPIQFENYSPALKRHYEVFAFCPAPGQFAVLFVDITERVGAEAELRSVNERLNSVLSSITDAYIAFDSEWRFVELNPVAEQILFHRPASDLLGKVFMEVYPRVLEAEFYQQYLAAIAEDHPVHFETFVNEHLGWFEVHAYPRAGRIEIYLRDISERKQAEEQIASLARFPEENPNPVLRINREGKLLYANGASRRLLDKWALQVNELVPAFWRDLVGKTLTMGCEQHVQFNTGEIIYSITACPIVDASYVNLYGRDITELVKVTQALQASRDDLELRVQERTEELKVANAVLKVEIAERVRAEESLRLANAYTRSLIEASLDPLVTITSNGKVGDVNNATEVVTGFSRQELIGTDFHTYFTDPEKARLGYQQVFETGTVRDYELQIRHKDGHITSVLYNASIFHDEGGEIKGVFAAARDITERLRMQQNLMEERKHLLELSQAEREQRLFAESSLAPRSPLIPAWTWNISWIIC